MSDWITDFKNVIFKGDKNIDLQEDILPMILQNNMGHVIKGQMLQLTSELLSAKVMDTTNAPSDDIIFTLSPPVNNPKEGLLLFYWHIDVNVGEMNCPLSLCYYDVMNH